LLSIEEANDLAFEGTSELPPLVEYLPYFARSVSWDTRDIELAEQLWWEGV
jgi:hypothetical protein